MKQQFVKASQGLKDDCAAADSDYDQYSKPLILLLNFL